jgi:AcrR family transcriptional regulator
MATVAQVAPTSSRSLPRAADDEAVAPARSPGRPRRFEAEEEQRLLLDAAFDALRERGYAALTVADVLGRAGLSTRSFYRHFASKDDLLRAVFRHDAERFAANVGRRVAATADAGAAIVTWIDEVLAFGMGRPRARRATVLGSPSLMAAIDPGEVRRALDLLLEPLAAALEAGRDDGTFAAADPALHAPMVSAMAWEVSNRLRDAGGPAQRAVWRASLLELVDRALGARPVPDDG